MIRIFIGYSYAAPVASSVAEHSIVSRATQPVSITKLALNQLAGIYTRPRDPMQSTDFSFSRFLVPYLCDYQGWAIFMDDDMIVLDDIAKLWALRDESKAVQVVKHDHEPCETVKFRNRIQTKYQKKNWSSVMLFNNAECRALTPEYVNTASGLDLHQFKWTTEDKIGDLPRRWNHLVGHDEPNLDAAIIHYTSGGPFYEEFKHCESSELWVREWARMLYCEQR